MTPKRRAVTPPAPEPDPKRQAKAPTTLHKQLIVPIDQSFRLSVTEPKVYIDDDEVVFDASLNQTNISKNNNKFYCLQLIESSAGNGGLQYWCTTRWGRVGKDGQDRVAGPDSLEVMMDMFCKKFKDKTGLSWVDRAEEPKVQKYVYLERDYDEMFDDGGVDQGNVDLASGNEAPSTIATSKLPEEVQSLVKLIFDQTNFDVTLQSLGYDSKKLPLGKLGKSAIMRAYGYLKEIEHLLNNRTLPDGTLQDLSSEALEELSNVYYSTIPHMTPGFQRLEVVDNLEKVKKENDMLDDLQRMEASNDIMEEAKKKRRHEQAEKMTLLDQHFDMLKLDEMTPIDSDSAEYQNLFKYLVNTTGSTHSMEYNVHNIFRIRRNGEWERFEEKYGNRQTSCRKLLWHGSSTSNFGGILSQGLRIAPPEAPASGYMFGKAIYLADLSSKSANYCRLHSNPTGLLLVCEAELGEPMLELVDADFEAGEKARIVDCIATHGLGMTRPSSWVDAEIVHPSLKGVMMPDPEQKPKIDFDGIGVNLLYNEYMTYDEAQVRLRYLIRFENASKY